LITLLLYVLVEKYIYILALEVLQTEFQDFPGGVGTPQKMWWHFSEQR